MGHHAKKRDEHHNGVNVSDMERIFSAFSGSMLATYGMTRKSVSGLALTTIGGMMLHRGVSGYCPFYEAAQIDTSGSGNGHGIEIKETMTIDRPREEVYASWRNFEKLPMFMRHIESIKQLDERRSEWHARLPAGMGKVSWQSEVTKEKPNEKIAWHSLPDSVIQNSGKVTFRDAPGDHGTELTLKIKYHPPGGKIGQAAAGLLTPAFSKTIREDIRRFKSLMETEEIPFSDVQPSGL